MPESVERHRRQCHSHTHVSCQDAVEEVSEQSALADAAPPPQHWKGRPPRRMWRQLRQAVLARDEGTCYYCGTRSGRMTCDHQIPVSRGGSSTLDNLVAACLNCNSAKATKTAEEWAHKHTRPPRREGR
jgi:5-methylcytosine-specific restriction endonuclease McrA